MRPQTKHINIKYHHFREHISYWGTSYFYLRTTACCWYVLHQEATCTEHLSQTQEASAALLVSSHASSIPIEWGSVTLQWTLTSFGIVQLKLTSILHMEPMDKRIMEPIVFNLITIKTRSLYYESFTWPQNHFSI
jgi:hypothetical protein